MLADGNPGACSMVALHTVAPAAEHLKIFGHRLAALRPRHDVIPLHLLKLEVSSAFVSAATVAVGVCSPSHPTTTIISAAPTP